MGCVLNSVPEFQMLLGDLFYRAFLLVCSLCKFVVACFITDFVLAFFFCAFVSWFFFSHMTFTVDRALKVRNQSINQ